MELTKFREAIREYRRYSGKTQKDLAEAVGLHPNVLSTKLNGSGNDYLNYPEIKRIISTLASWKAISTRSEAVELLALMQLKEIIFTLEEWNSSPLNQLETSADGQNLQETDSLQRKLAAKAETKRVFKENSPNNIPHQLTSFIGRENEIHQLKQLITQNERRLVTLVGAGGCGKTRLSLQVAAELLDSFPEGVWFVELAPLSDPARVAQTIAITLAVFEEIGRPLLSTLSDYFRNRRILLVLDNCEHLVEECARVVDSLTRSSNRLHILTSSREPLGLSGETTFRVPSLNLPDSQAQPEADELSSYEAVKLFMERVNAVNPTFSLNSQNAGAVLQICRQLDGIPLALELAAARTKLLTVGQLANRLDDRFQLLTGGSRASLPRQQTLRALVDWSYELLTPTEKRLLTCLSVFVGGWTFGAAVAVVGVNNGEKQSYGILDGLTGLVNKSLAQLEHHADESEARYSFLETIRQYGMEKLKASGDEQEVRTRHLAYYARQTQELGPKLQSKEQSEVINLLDRELDNVRAAIKYGLSTEQAGLVSEVVIQLAGYWDMRGNYSEGRDYLEKAIIIPTMPRENRVVALFYVGFFCHRQEDLVAAAHYFEECLALSEGQEDKTVIWGLAGMGLLHLLIGNYAKAEYYQEKAVELAKEMGNYVFGGMLANLSLILVEQGDYREAGRLGEAALAIAREMENQWFQVLHLGNLAGLALVEEDYPKALKYTDVALDQIDKIGFEFGKSISLAHRGMALYQVTRFKEARDALAEGLTLIMKGYERFKFVDTMVGVAGLLHKLWLKNNQERHLEKLATVCGAITAYLTATGNILLSPERIYFNQALVDARAGLTEASFNEGFAQGQVMSVQEAIIYSQQLLAEIEF